MADKQRKTGLGVDVFFPAPREDVLPMSPTRSDRAKPTNPPMGERGEEELPAPSNSMNGKAETEVPREATEMGVDRAEHGTEQNMVKLTVMVSQDIFDQLEELKHRERRRLRREGGERGRNWRRQVTITQFVDVALAEFLMKKGFKSRIP